MVLRTGQNKCSNHIESGFLHENASAKTTTIKIVCEKWGLGYHYLSGKAMVFPLVIYRCESWTIKKAEHWTLVLEKTLESPLVSKEIKPVNPKGNQPWIVTRRTDAKAPKLWPPDSKTHWNDSFQWLLGKTLMLGKFEDRRRRGWQRMRWLDDTIDSVDMSLSKPQKRVKDREVWHAAVHGVAELDMTEY